MPTVRIHRYDVAPSQIETFLERRTQLIGAIRAAHPGLLDTRLVRTESGAFVDSWHWRSHEEMQAALGDAPRMPEVAAAMSLVGELTADDGHLVDAR